MGKKIYVYGYGNPGRQDDGIGPCIADKTEQLNIPGVSADSNYQLNVEDACDIAQADEVIFADASADGPEPFSFTEIVPASEVRFTTHTLAPDSLMALCREMFGKEIPAHILAVRGYSWEFSGTMTPEAEENMEKAFLFLKERLEKACS